MQSTVFRDLLRISLPLMIGSFIQTLYNLTDAYCHECDNDGIGAGKVSKGDVVVIRYVGPRGGPGMPEMLKPKLNDPVMSNMQKRFCGAEKFSV